MVKDEERSRKVMRNAAAMLFSNVAGMLVSIATVPITLAALGTDAYGTLQTMTALGGLVAMGDLGLGLAMRTRVGKLAGAGRGEEIRTVLGEAVVTLAALGALLIAVGAALLCFVDFGEFFHLPPELREQGTAALAISGLAFAISMPLGVLTAAHYGLQLRHRLIGWYAGGNIFAALAGAATAYATHRIDLSLAVQTLVNLAATAGASWVGCRMEPCTVPRLVCPKLRDVVTLVRSGIAYYAFQAELTIIGGLDNIVIARIAGVEAVAIYSVAYRLIRIAFSLVYSLGDSFWNGVAHAIGSGDVEWVRTEARLLRRFATVAMTILASGFVAAAVPMIEVWTRGRIHADPWLTLGLGLYFGLYGHTMIDGSILAGAGRMRPLLVVVGCEAVVNLVASVILAQYFGYVGVGFGTLIGYVICDFVPIQVASRRVLAPEAGDAPRARLWTTELSALVVSIGASFLVYEMFIRPMVASNFAAIAVGGVLSVVLSLGAVRVVGGPEAMAVATKFVSRILAPLRRGRGGAK